MSPEPTAAQRPPRRRARHVLQRHDKDHANRSAGPGNLVRREIGRYALLSVFSLVIVMLVLGRLSRRIGTEEAISDAKRSVFVVATSIIEPQLTEETVRALTIRDHADRDAAFARMDVVAEQARRSGGLARIKLWDASGNLVYADDHRLLRAGVRLDDKELQVIRQRGIEAEVSDLSKAENQFDRGQGRLLEVYLAVRTSHGQPMLFESYLPYSRVTVGSRRVLLEFAPVVLAGLFALQCTGVVLVWSVARRLRRTQQQRELLLQHAVDASDAERRRIAADLHDTVVQDLTGVTLALAATRISNSKGLVGENGPTDVESQIREVVHSLRSLIVEIYPPNLRSEGLTAAIRSLCARLHNRGITTSLRSTVDDIDLPDAAVALCYRVVQETLRNVSTHAEASHVDITVEVRDAQLVAVVDDDGQGFDLATIDERVNDGHVGLRGLGDLVSEWGGSLRLHSSPGVGTAVVLRLPLPSPR